MDIKDIPEPETKVKMTLIGYFGNNVEIEGKIIGEPYTYGFNSPSGWGLYDISDKGYSCTPSYRIKFKKKRQKSISIIDIEDIINIVEIK